MIEQSPFDFFQEMVLVFEINEIQPLQVLPFVRQSKVVNNKNLVFTRIIQCFDNVATDESGSTSYDYQDSTSPFGQD